LEDLFGSDLRQHPTADYIGVGVGVEVGVEIVVEVEVRAVVGVNIVAFVPKFVRLSADDHWAVTEP